MTILTIVRILFISNFFLTADLKCFVSSNVSYCDNLKDLQQEGLEKSVRITGNKLEEFQKIPIQSSKEIEFLSIMSSINKLNKNAFENFSKLEILSLRQNSLTTIEKGIFENLNITKLVISDSKVENIEDKSLINLPNLQELRMTNNSLTEIKKSTFRNLPLEVLALSRNSISKIEKLAFEKLPNLSKLYLDNNFLRDFNAIEYVSDAKKLERLWLHFNNFTHITNYMLEGLTNLKVLNLGFNQISSIEPQSFARTPQLTTLVLSNNFLQTIDGSVLPIQGLDFLKVLYLDHNRLMFLSSNFLLRLKVLTSMSIGGNPWLCSCLDLLLKFLDTKKVKLKCDKDYFSGEKPICVAVGNTNDCTYVYQSEIRTYYENSSVFYQPDSFCFL